MRTSTIKNKRTGQTRKKVERSNKLASVFGFAVIGILGFIIHTNYAAISVINTLEDTSKLFSLLTPSYTGIDFENKVVEGPDRGMQFYDYFYNGSGLAIGDLNNDDLPDLFFTGNNVPNRLYINKGNFQFEDVSIAAGIQSNRWATGVTLVDINQDGLMDVYICNSGPYMDANSTANELYINRGNNVFSEEAANYGIADGSRSTQATFFDMDKDGDLDLWVMNHGLRNRGAGSNVWLSQAATLDKAVYNRECSTLYRNDGNGHFTDISESAGIQKIGFGLGMAIRDFDEDGFLDVYIANDFFIPDFFFKNNGNGTFTDVSNEKIAHSPYYAMGCDAADVNNDGLTDLMIVDMTPADHVRNKVLMSSMDVVGFEYLTEAKQYQPQYMYNSLFINSGLGVMSDIGLFAGVSQTDWSWAPLLADFNNDGWKDLMVTNGFRKDTKNNDWKNELIELRNRKGSAYSPADYFEHLKKADVNPVPNQIFQNTGGLKFEQNNADWGFETPSSSNGAAYADLDQDGDLDLVINNFDQPAFVYRNNSRENNSGNFIRFKLKNGKTSNAVMHSKICLFYKGEMQCNDYAFTRGYQSFVEPVLHFGLGDNEVVDRAVITWLDGQESIIKNPAINQVHEIDRQSIDVNEGYMDIKPGLFTNISKSHIQPQFIHRENEFDDFSKEILLPHRQSMLGPAISVGDVNSDGLDDFYVGGAQGQAGMLYMQDKDARFNAKATIPFIKDSGYEDVGAKFLDVDGDSDLDLYVASGGGGEFEDNEGMLQDRLYINDGRGIFTAETNRLPPMPVSTKSIAACDFDKDGDLDLFVGGRTSPGKYPKAPESFLLINENGSFSNQTQSLAPELKALGMVTDAQWSDINKDGKEDLLVVGEWMPITVFIHGEKGLTNETEALGLSKTSGWWNSLAQADFDQDG
ncbi:MAG: VCBS repeat-containing protein, partial [Crocinitomicaceae bacterium]|nr:VCBS repeat-containing protein [Crocinitomicaceae bacterium]